MTRPLQHAALVFATLLLLAGCDSDPRELCQQHAECADFCLQLGLPADGADCESGRCRCAVPDMTLADLAPDLIDDSSLDPDTGTPDSDLDSLDGDAQNDGQIDVDTPADPDVVELRDADTADVVAQPCPPDMADMGTYCIDRYEAPNYEAASPLVMYTFDEAAAWCAFRSKRLCFDDEWTAACEGAQATAYPYGANHQPGVCNDDETWIVYNQTRLSDWPWDLPTSEIDSLSALFSTARSVGPAAEASVDHVEAIYQAEPSGENAGCTNETGTFDLTGNVEEWTRRRDGGSGPDFSGNLKGRYWAETRTCQANITTHGNGFRFYEIGFRCCSDPG